MDDRFKRGKFILSGIDFTELKDCWVEEKDGIFYLIVKYNEGETSYVLGLKKKLQCS
jgi:hypothetical protein